MLLAYVLFLLGSIIAVGSLVLTYWLASLACAMNTTACLQDGRNLFGHLMTSSEGLIFWAGMVAGTFLVWWGLRVKERAAARR